MEEFLPLSLLVSSVALLFFSYFVVRAFYSLWWKPKSLEKHLRKQGIRGNSYRLFFGDMVEDMQAMKEAWSCPMDKLTHRIVPRVLHFTYRTVQKYGCKSCMIWGGTTPKVVILDLEMMRDIFLDKLGQFKKLTAPNPLMEHVFKGVNSLEGEEWANRRRMINPAFHLEKLKRMVPSFQTSCIDMIKRWDKLIGIEGSCEVDVWPEFQNLTGNVISRTAFGSSYEEGKRIFELQKEETKLAIEATQVPYIPGFRFIPTTKNKRRVFLKNEIRSAIREVINKKLIMTKETGASDTNDLLGLLLQHLKYQNNDMNKKNAITIDEVIEECKLFYLAGEETTSVWLTWALVLLSMHPDWQQKAREEVLRTCGDKAPDFESISQLKIVTMILYEVLRLYPPVASLFRRIYKETKLGHLCLPADIDIVLPVLLVHHDPKYWGEDAEDFNPERFSEGISKACKGGHNAFFPFGWGPRICIGQSFANIEAKLALAIILQHFSFELSPAYVHAPYIVLTVQPQYGAHIILHRL